MGTKKNAFSNVFHPGNESTGDGQSYELNDWHDTSKTLTLFEAHSVYLDYIKMKFLQDIQNLVKFKILKVKFNI